MSPLVIVGQIEFPSPEAEKEWRAQRLAPQSDWPQDLPLFRGESPRELATVGDVLAAMAALDKKPSFFDLEGIEMRGLLMPDAVERLHQDFATAMRQAASVGADGSVAFMVLGTDVSFHLPIGEDVCGHDHDHDHAHDHDHGEDCDHDHDHDHEHVHGPTWLGTNQLLSDEALARQVLAVLDFFKTWEAEDMGRDAYVARELTLGLAPIAEQPHHREVLDRLAKVDPTTLHDAVEEADVRSAMQRELLSFYETPEELAAGIAKADAPARAAAIEMLALVDAGAAEPLIERFLDDPSMYVRRHAVRALGHVPTDAAFRRLLAFDEAALAETDQFLAIALTDALGHNDAEGADAASLEGLEGPAFTASTWSKLDRVEGAVTRAKLAVRAAQILKLVAERKIVSAEPALVALFESHPAEEVRVAAAGALAQLSGPLAREHEQALAICLHGMGKALNQDDARRAELLGVDTRDESLGIVRFDDIDGATLGRLMAERFVDPDNTQNDSPSVADFSAILTEFPELRVGGYAVPASRDDYRISVDSVHGKLDGVPADRRAEIAELFEKLGETATNTDPEGKTFRCWWT